MSQVFTPTSFFYFNFSPQEGFTEALRYRFDRFVKYRLPENLNFWGYYTSFIRKTFVRDDRNWWSVLFFTGFPGLLTFSVLLFRILNSVLMLDPNRSLAFTLIMLLNPNVIMSGASWLRDIWIYNFLLLAVLSSYKKDIKVFVCVTIVQSLIRLYMFVPHILAWLLIPQRSHLTSNNSVLGKDEHAVRQNNLNYLKAVLITFGVIGLFYALNGLNIHRLPIILAQNFTPVILYSAFKGLVPRFSLYSFLYDIDVYAWYWFAIFYFVLYLRLFIRIAVERRLFDDVEKNFFLLFILTGLYMGSLHTFYIGFLVPRVVFITIIYAFFLLCAGCRRYNMKP